MTEPRIVTPEEAQGRREIDYDREEWDLIHTVATEPDRIRAAVVRAFRTYAQDWRKRAQLRSTMTGRHEADAHADVLDMGADAIENGADW